MPWSSAELTWMRVHSGQISSRVSVPSRPHRRRASQYTCYTPTSYLRRLIGPAALCHSPWKELQSESLVKCAVCTSLAIKVGSCRWQHEKSEVSTFERLYSACLITMLVQQSPTLLIASASCIVRADDKVLPATASKGLRPSGIVQRRGRLVRRLYASMMRT